MDNANALTDSVLIVDSLTRLFLFSPKPGVETQMAFATYHTMHYKSLLLT
jgi:hypothetical protein